MILSCSSRPLFNFFFSSLWWRWLRMTPVAVNGREKMDYNFLFNIFAFFFHIKGRSRNPPLMTDQLLGDFLKIIFFFFLFYLLFFLSTSFFIANIKCHSSFFKLFSLSNFYSKSFSSSFLLFFIIPKVFLFTFVFPSLHFD